MIFKLNLKLNKHEISKILTQNCKSKTNLNFKQNFNFNIGFNCTPSLDIALLHLATRQVDPKWYSHVTKQK